MLRAPPTIDPSPLHIQKVHPAKPYDDRTREELIYEIELVKGKTEEEQVRVRPTKSNNSDISIRVRAIRAKRPTRVSKGKTE